jgi:hypothetical protein
MTTISILIVAAICFAGFILGFGLLSLFISAKKADKNIEKNKDENN